MPQTHHSSRRIFGFTLAGIAVCLGGGALFLDRPFLAWRLLAVALLIATAAWWLTTLLLRRRIVAEDNEIVGLRQRRAFGLLALVMAIEAFFFTIYLVGLNSVVIHELTYQQINKAFIFVYPLIAVGYCVIVYRDHKKYKKLHALEAWLPVLTLVAGWGIEMLHGYTALKITEARSETIILNGQPPLEVIIPSLLSIASLLAVVATYLVLAAASDSNQ